MNEGFRASYKLLNAEQKSAVDQLDGPLLVIAGPGTGKTQLLSTRAANILNQGVVNAGNILCLTYTEAGASEMRSRMSRIMGPAANEIAVHTFHSFGTWLINQYPEYFSQERSLAPLNDLGRYRIFEDLLAQLPLRHQLAVRGEGDTFIRRYAVEEAVRAFKQAGMSPAMLRQIAKQNKSTFSRLQPLLDELFTTTLSAKRLPSIAALIAQVTEKAQPHTLDAILCVSLTQAVSDAIAAGKTGAIGTWRSNHTVIKDGRRVLKSQAGSIIFNDIIMLYESYQARLTASGQFDYEDMIIWASQALEQNQDMRLDVAERFQYVMVDEFQDTNGAQNRMLNAVLQANPLNSPNVMVVGDDDQAIMRFQGAEASGMLEFVATYDPKIIVLTTNYRSGQAVLDASRQIVTQTNERLEVALPNYKLTKLLVAATDSPSHIAHWQYASPSAQYAAVAEHIFALLEQGISASEIAVIGRKHAELASFVPYVTVGGISTNYNRHDNILAQPFISQLLELANCIARIAVDPKRADTVLPQILAAEYWQLAPLDSYRLAATVRENKTSWLDSMLGSSTSYWPSIAEWLIAAAAASQTHNFTQFFDILIGRTPLPDTTLEYSPFKTYLDERATESYITLLSNLICLRTAVLEARPSATGITDLLEVANEYKSSDIRLVDTNPILRGDAEGVQVMSAHGAKGREFEHVIILSATDTIWGPKARSNNQRVRLPENLPLYPAGDADSDRLRLLYVAMTRAKSELLLTSFTESDGGKAVAGLSYINLGEQPGWWQPIPQKTPTADVVRANLETAWLPRTEPSRRSLQEVLKPLLTTYKLSASGLRNFLDVCYAGPTVCIEQSVLGFPSAHNSRSALGSAAHKAVEALYQAQKVGAPLTHTALLKIFDKKLDASGLTESELRSVREHGHQFLPVFAEQYSANDLSDITATEQYLSAELKLAGSTESVPISGYIDALKLTNNGVEVIDYKTGKPPLPNWETKGLSDSKKLSQHFYYQQLLFYKLLIDNSTFYKLPASHAELIFLEPNEQGQFVRLHIDSFEQNELDRMAALITTVYARIAQADLPDISGYSKDLKGVEAFESDLLNSK